MIVKIKQKKYNSIYIKFNVCNIYSQSVTNVNKYNIYYSIKRKKSKYFNNHNTPTRT